MGIYIGLVSANVTLEAMPTYYGNRSMDVNFNEKFGFERPTQLKVRSWLKLLFQKKPLTHYFTPLSNLMNAKEFYKNWSAEVCHCQLQVKDIDRNYSLKMPKMGYFWKLPVETDWTILIWWNTKVFSYLSKGMNSYLYGYMMFIMNKLEFVLILKKNRYITNIALLCCHLKAKIDCI